MPDAIREHLTASPQAPCDSRLIESFRQLSQIVAGYEIFRYDQGEVSAWGIAIVNNDDRVSDGKAGVCPHLQAFMGQE